MNSIERKTVYRVTFTYPTIEGSVETGTKWFKSIDSIPSEYLRKEGAKLWERSYNMPIYPMKEWDMDEVIKEVVH